MCGAVTGTLNLARSVALLSRDALCRGAFRLMAAASSSALSLDVVMTAAPRDYPMFPSNIESIMTQVAPRVRNIFVIVPPSIIEEPSHSGSNCTKAVKVRLPVYSDGCSDTVVNRSRTVAAQHGARLHFISEDRFAFAFNISSRSVGAFLPPQYKYRASWYTQQFLKLYAHRFIRSLGDHLLLDSEVLFHRPMDFVAGVTADGKPTSYRYETSPLKPEERNYFKTIACLTNNQVRRFETRSGVVDMLMISLHVLRELMATVEANHKAPFWVAAMRCVQSLGPASTQSDFSEYETYFQYARHNHPRTMSISNERVSSNTLHGWLFGRG